MPDVSKKESNVKVHKYKDKIILIASENNSQQTNNSKTQYLLAINNLPRITRDKEIKLEVPTINDLIDNQKNLEVLLKEKLQNLVLITIVVNIESKNNVYDANNTTISFDYKNNLITLKDGEKADKIQSSTNLPSIKIVKANITDNKKNNNTSINFKSLENAVILNAILKNLVF